MRFKVVGILRLLYISFYIIIFTFISSIVGCSNIYYNVIIPLVLLILSDFRMLLDDIYKIIIAKELL